MKAVVLDGFTLNPGDLTWDSLKSLCDTAIYERTSYSASEKALIISRAKEAEVLFTNKTPLSAEILKALPKLRFICVLATGYNIVDISTAKELGVVVTNIPSYGTNAVAQMTIALLLEMCQHVGTHNTAVHQGAWNQSKDWCFWHYPLIELTGKTMGIIGLGRIGQATAKIAQALGMNIAAYSSTKYPELESNTLRFTSLDELLSISDVISLHCPLSANTTGIINKVSIAKMKDGVLLINTSRGPLIVEADLADALNLGKVAGAAVDVVSNEPIHADNPLLTAKNCIITPHISWAPKETRQRLLDIAIANLKAFLSGNPINVINF